MKPLHISWLILTLFATPLAASADPGPKDARAGNASDAVGKAHFQRGQRLSAQGDYAGAYRAFEAGYSATGRPLFLFNMAEAARASGDVARARDHYEAFVRLDPSSALAATAKARLAELAPPALAPPPAEPVPPLLPPSATPPLAQRGPGEGQPLPPGPPAAQASDAPVWKKWPFWAAVAGTVVVGGAVVYVVSRDSSACGAGCTQLNYR